MKYRVTIEVDVPEIPGHGSRQEAFRLTMADALIEFGDRRRDGASYVAARYPLAEGYAWVNRPEKIAQVEARSALARAMLEAMKVEAVGVAPSLMSDRLADADSGPWVLERTDQSGGYVTPRGSEKSYTPDKAAARRFSTRAEAEQESCGNERPVKL